MLQMVYNDCIRHTWYEEQEEGRRLHRTGNREPFPNPEGEERVGFRLA